MRNAQLEYIGGIFLADKRDYYEVLGVEKGASEDDIKKAFRKKAKLYPPTYTQTTKRQKRILKR